MIDKKTLSIGLGATTAWLLLCILLFDRWFFFSPVGLILTFCPPALGWFLWWRYAPREGREISPEEREILDKGQGLLRRLKESLNRQSRTH